MKQVFFFLVVLMAFSNCSKDGTVEKGKIDGFEWSWVKSVQVSNASKIDVPTPPERFTITFRSDSLLRIKNYKTYMGVTDSVGGFVQSPYKLHNDTTFQVSLKAAPMGYGVNQQIHFEHDQKIIEVTPTSLHLQDASGTVRYDHYFIKKNW